MIDPRKYKYTVMITSQKKEQFDVTDLAEEIIWEEAEGELAARITVTVRNIPHRGVTLAAIARPGAWIALTYRYNNGARKEAVRGRIVEWNPTAKNNKKQFKIKAYDVLYDMQESQDNVYFSSGTRTESAIRQLLDRWDIPIGTYAGPNVKHKKMAYKSEKIGTIIIKILKEAKKKGGKDAVLRSSKGKVSVYEYGANDVVYTLTENSNITEMNHTITTVGMITRVKVIGQKDDDGKAPVDATLDGRTEYGIRQKISTRSKDTSLDEAKEAAQDILDDEGDPKETMTVTAPDIPIIHKGDILYLRLSTVHDQYFYCTGISHNVTKGVMTLELERAGKKRNRDKSKKDKSAEYEVGDVLIFEGGKVYETRKSDAKSSEEKEGKVKVIKVKPSAAHPYKISTQNWSKTHAKGWVDEYQLQKEDDKDSD